MSWLSRPSVLLTVRGTLIPTDREEVRKVHNQTAGSDEGVAAARALGDLSHKVFTPMTGAPGASENELLFIDVWKDPDGLGTFFSDAQVQHGGSILFSEREAVVWMPAESAFGFELPPPMHFTDRLLGLARGSIDDPAKAVSVFRETLEPTISDARRLGQISHQLYIRLQGPNGDEPLEALGVDVWSDGQGMGEHYGSLSGFEAAFSGEPVTSVWEQAPGGIWTEW